MPEKDLASEPISDLQLDRYLAGELDEHAAAQLVARLAVDTTLKARLSEIEAARRAFALEAPSFAGIVASATKDETPGFGISGVFAWLRGLAAVAAAAGVVAVISQTGAVEHNRTKGSRFLEVALSRDGVVLSTASTSSTSIPTLYPDDLVQFAVDAGDGAQVAVLSRDAEGTISVYAPTSGALETAQGRHVFGNSTRLDDVVGDEVFVGVRCQSAVPTAVLKDGIRQGLAAPDGCEFDVFTVRKTAIPVPQP